MTVIVAAGFSPASRDEKFLKWLEKHGLQPENTYKVEIGDTAMTVYQYAVGATGREYYDESKKEVATLEPYEVELVEPLPEDVEI